MKHAIEAAVWWVYRHIFPVSSIGDLKFIDIRTTRADSAEIRRILADALEYVDQAHVYRQLVSSELTLIAANMASRESVSPQLGIYASPFVGHERTNSFFLACRLVWAAAYIRSHRSCRMKGLAVDDSTLRSASDAEEIGFIKQFPEAQEWLNYVRAAQ